MQKLKKFSTGMWMFSSLLDFTNSIKVSGVIYRLQLSRQSILGFFWPFFRLMVIPFFAYISYGSVLEQDSGIDNVSYRAYVLSGLIPWIFLSLLLTNFIRLNSSAKRREDLLSPNNDSVTSALGVLYTYRYGLFFLIILLGYMGFGYWPSPIAVLKILLYVLLLILLTLCMLPFCWFISILSSLTRDVRHFIPYLMTALLIVTPIYYSPRNANSFLESFLSHINVLSFFIDLGREVVFGSMDDVFFSFAKLFSLCLLVLPFYLFGRIRISIENYFFETLVENEEFEEF